MLAEIATGTALLLLNIVIAAIAAMTLEIVFQKAGRWLVREPHRPKLVLMLAGVSLWILGIVTVGVWIWALAYWSLGIFTELEEAVYFSLVVFTTLGFGDLLIPPGWRLLAGMEAANGLLNFGLLTALLIEGLRNTRLAQVQHRLTKKTKSDQASDDAS